MSVISRGADWDFDLLEKYDLEISRIAANYGLDTYPNQIEVITSEQMLDAYASSGLPVGYPHWSVRQGVHPQRAGVPARHAGTRVRDRHQLEPLHRLSDGREHDGDAGAGHRARLVRPQLLLQGEPPVSASGPRPTRSSIISCSRDAS
jgi:hypothetical protein